MKKKKLFNFSPGNSSGKIFWLMITFTFVMHFGLYAQDVEVKGVVKSDNAETISGAYVVLKGTRTGTVTDNNGAYTIKVPGNSTLTFSFIGFITQEIPVEGRSTIDITLKEDVESLSEVVVIGYGTQRKSDLTGAVVSVKAGDIEKMPVITTDQVLQGRAAGVTVTTNSGSPGSAAQIRVRGVGTINDASPLFVVDGFPVNDITFLNPSDIASMEVLKDASSSAIYGARGANGVILITTKNGKAGTAPVISLDMHYGFSKMWRKPSLLSASEWAMLKNEALENGGLDRLPELEDYQSLGEGTDWVKEVSRTAHTRQINFSVSGGNDKLLYFLSANNLNDEGIIKKSSFNRTSLRLNTTLNAKSWFTMGENLSIESNTQRRVNENDEWSAVLIQAVAIDPITPVYLANGKFAPSDYVDMNNPVAHIDRTNASSKSFGVTGNVFANLTFFKGFMFKSNLGISYNFGNDYDFLPTYYVSGAESNDVSAVSRGSSENRSWNWSNYLTYSKDLGNHSVNVMAGMESSEDYSEWFSTRATRLLKEFVQLRYINTATNPVATSSGLMSVKKMISYFGRLNYDYSNKYLLTVNIRRDGSSIFGPDNRYGVFPSLSAGWKINEDGFMSGIGFISNLKLRAGWGKIGNDKIPPYGYATLASLGRRYVIDNVIVDGLSFPSEGNRNVQWETTATSNIGLDLGLWNNKLTMSAEYYVKKTTDMLVDVPVLAHVGTQQNPFMNIGSMKNSGFELELNFKDMVGKFSYDVGLNFATFTNEVTFLGSQDVIMSAPLRDVDYVTRTMVGYPIAQFWGYKTNGLFQSQEEVEAWTDGEGNMLQPNAGAGDIKYAKGSDGNLYYGVIGNPLPDFTYGVNIQLNYSQFDLVVFLQGVYGNDVFNGTKVYTDRPDGTHNMSSRMLNRWTGPGSTNDAHFPRLNAADANNIWFSDRYVEDGSYLRIKNMQLGYTLPAGISNALKIQQMRLYVGATNLLTFTKYLGFDPEIGVGYYGSLDLGVDRATYPQPRTFLFGLNLSF